MVSTVLDVTAWAGSITAGQGAQDEQQDRVRRHAVYFLDCSYRGLPRQCMLQGRIGPAESLSQDAAVTQLRCDAVLLHCVAFNIQPWH